MQSKCKVTFDVYKHTELFVSYDETQLVFLMRPQWALYLLGWLGQKLVPPTKELFRIWKVDIQSIVVVDMGQSESTYELVMKNGKVCRLVFKKGDELAAAQIDDFKDKLHFS